ncbi:putative ribonuclease H-like domain-containing protein [Tanacetum coccineum]
MLTALMTKSEIITKGYAQASSSKMKETSQLFFQLRLKDDLIKNKEQTQNTVKSNTDRNKVIIEDWVDSDDEEIPLGFSEIKKQNVLKSETSSENKSPRSKDSFGQRSGEGGLVGTELVKFALGSRDSDQFGITQVGSKMSQAVPSQSTASAFYQNTARLHVSKAVLSQNTARPYFPRPVFNTSTGRPYYPRMDNVRNVASSLSPPMGFLPFHLEAFSDSDYAGDNHDRRSTSGGCQYLGRRLVSWQCKKQTIVAISSTEAENVAAASCCRQSTYMLCEEFHVFPSKLSTFRSQASTSSEIAMSKLILWSVHTDDNVTIFRNQRI